MGFAEELNSSLGTVRLLTSRRSRLRCTCAMSACAGASRTASASAIPAEHVQFCKMTVALKTGFSTVIWPAEGPVGSCPLISPVAAENIKTDFTCAVIVVISPLSSSLSSLLSSISLTSAESSRLKESTSSFTRVKLINQGRRICGFVFVLASFLSVLLVKRAPYKDSTPV